MRNCPWTLDTVKQSNFLESCKQGFQDIIDSAIICTTMLTVIGYGVTRNDLTTFQIKIVFFSTISKFLQTQIEGSLSKYPTMVPTLISSEIGFLICVTLVTLAYLYHNFKLIYFSMRSMDSPVFVHCRNQVIYRRNVLIASYIIILIYAGSEIAITAIWCSFLF